tara:strand:+ start:1569 stop:1751 length:183 start_codon:yes stop_codon:yes gene_type:complete
MKVKLLLMLTILVTYGCVLTKVVTVPLRVGGAVISVVPWAGDKMHDAIDTAADTIDDIPI